MTQEQEAVAIDEGKVLADFIEHPVVRAHLSKLEQDYFLAFKGATTPAEREAVWAKTQALSDIAVALKAGADRGKLAQHARTQRVTAEERAEAAKTRRR